MINDQNDATTIINAHKKHDAWNKKRMEIYDELIELADINDSKLSDSIEHNLEYAMEIILQYGTYAENAKALRMYAEYFNLCKLLEI
jgi:hypothetical protein